MNRRPLTEEELAEANRLAAAWKAYKAQNRGATQAWLAKETDIGSQAAVGQYLRGVIPLNLQALLAFSDVLELDPVEVSPRLTRRKRPTWSLNAIKKALISPQQSSSSQTREAKAEASVQVLRYANPGAQEQPTWIANVSFSQPWLTQLASSKALADPEFIVMIAPDDSMAPRLQQGDTLLVDKANTKIEDDAVCALEAHGKVRIKRLFIRFDGNITVHSDNRTFPDEIAPPDSLRLIGRVVGLVGVV